MNEFKIGGEITLGENEKYIIVDIVKIDDEIYYFASTRKKPIIPKIFQRIDENGKTYIDFIDDPEIIKKVTNKIMKG